MFFASGNSTRRGPDPKRPSLLAYDSTVINPATQDHPLLRAGLPLVCVQGLGFVGAAMAAATAASGMAAGQPRFAVVGVDLDHATGRERASAMEAGRFPFTCTDASLEQAVAAGRASGHLRASTDPAWYALADVLIVDVHLDVDAAVVPTSAHFAPFRAAITAIGQRLKPGALVLVESTVPPGTVAHLVAPELARCMSARSLPEDAFLLAHSYERVMPGADYLASITQFWRVYAGHTPAAAQACERFLSQVIDVARFPLTRLDSTTASETAKLMENSYRAVNIAFIEEWARLAEATGVDLFPVIAAIRMRPTHSNLRQPGFGVGGYCLTKDPLLPAVGAREWFGRADLQFPFCNLAVAINQRMPLSTLARVSQAWGGDLRGCRILLLGVSYRQEVADTRNSPSETFAHAARVEGALLVAHDPLVRDWPETGLAVTQALPSPAEVDVVLWAVPHAAYRQLDLAQWLGPHRPLLVDANAVLNRAQRQTAQALGCRLITIGAA